MQVLHRPKLTLLVATLALIAVIALPITVSAASLHTQRTASANTSHVHIDCSKGGVICADLQDSEAAFGEGHYVGHDEPSTLFYSNKPGSGNRMQWQLTLPKDPKPGQGGVPLPGQSFNFQLHGAFWLGMAMCDTQSYPEQVSTCTPDSDSNIVDPALSPAHPGTAFTELQFYPPGWVPWPTWAVAIGSSACDPTKWCAALNIDSLSENPVTGQLNNNACLGSAGLEYVNFAFLTKNGQSHAPASPLLATLDTFTPNPATDLFMNSGDKLVVTLHDSPDGLVTDVKDLTTGAHGSMVASAANGFGQVQFDPNGTTCNNIPYDFHPMYSTSSEQTNVTWAAHTYNIAFSDEIGHWDYCNGATVPDVFAGAPCPSGNTEGIANDTEPVDGDNATCFPASRATLIQLQGCTDTNTGFDSVPYQPVWPDGNPLHPTPIQFSSPLTGGGYNVQYSRVAFEADLPAIEANSDAANCNRKTGVGCTLIPETDDGQPAVFYPFFSIHNVGGQCVWQFGNHIPGSKNDFGQNAEYGTLLQSTFTGFGGGGAPITRYENFRQIYSKNPCPA